MTITANSKGELLNKISAYEVKKWPVSIEILEGARARSSAQNRLQHGHYRQVGKFMNLTETEAKNYCKLTYGIPILSRRLELDKFNALPYHTKLDLVELMDVTKLFIVSEAKEYTDNMMYGFATQGLTLSDPNDLVLQYWADEIEKENKRSK